MKAWLFLASVTWPFFALADAPIASRTLSIGHIITLNDIADNEAARQSSNLDELLGKEVKSTIFSGRPISMGSLGTPTLIERNQILTIAFQMGALTIKSEGRSLGRAAAGENLRVVNVSSNKIITVTIGEDGIGYANY